LLIVVAQVEGALSRRRAHAEDEESGPDHHISHRLISNEFFPRFELSAAHESKASYRRFTSTIKSMKAGEPRMFSSNGSRSSDEETLGPYDRRQIGPKQLERNRAVVLQVMCLVDRGH